MRRPNLWADPRAPAGVRYVTILFTITVLWVSAGWWKNEYDSCVRTSVGKTAYNRTVNAQLALMSQARDRARALSHTDTGERQRLDLAAVAAYDKLIANEQVSPPLSCLKVLPETGKQ